MEVADRFYLLDTDEEGQLEEGFEYSPPDKAIAVRENIAFKFMYSLFNYFSKRLQDLHFHTVTKGI